MTTALIPRQPRGCDELKAAAAELGVPKKDLLVLDPKNDPFNAGTTASLRDGKWFRDLWERFGYSGGVHNRRVHYQAVSTGTEMPNGEPYLNTVECWAVLETGSKAARDLGLIDPRLFADRRNAESRLFVQPRIDQPAISWEPYIDDRPLRELSGWRLPKIDPHDLILYGFPAGHAEVDGYDYDPDDQPYLLELWIEKSTMDDVLGPLCRELGANYTPGTGFTSKTRVCEMLARGQAHSKPVRVLVISDYDPAGSHMPAAIARTIEFYRDLIAPDVDFAVRHIGMTREWAERYDLPRAPIKEHDLRRGNFEAIHGEGCVELDALEALHPGALRREVQDAMLAYRDLRLPAKLASTMTAAAREANARWHAATAPIRGELGGISTEVLSIAGQYRARITELADELADELAPHRERLDELWTELGQLAEDLVPIVEMPARPEGETELADESAWLYRSDRNWLDQLAAYRIAKSGGESC